MNLSPKIGLEIHLELATKTKMFCGCLNDSLESHPNINICEICTGQPGTLPVLNKQAVISALKIVKAVGGKIQSPSVFARKNYFYPDLPKGYQISQYELPIGLGGELEYLINGESKKTRIRRIHLEEDTGRLIHSENASLIDFNRAGVPLLEIVTEPDIESAEEAKAFAEELILLIRYLKISEANAEKGEIRMEANISVSQNSKVKNQNDNSKIKSNENENLGTKVEVKNLNSLRALTGSIDYEIERQKELLLSGEKIIQETRGWDENKQKTFSQRIKEASEDYRYFPEPDLPPLVIFEDILSEVILPELPSQKRKRFQEEFDLSFKDVDLLIKQEKFSDFFEKAVSELQALTNADLTRTDANKNKCDPAIKILFNYLVNDLMGLFVKYQKTFEDVGLTPHHFAHLISKVIKGEYSSKIAKEILQRVIEKAESVEELMKQSKIITDDAELQKVVKEAIKENPKAVDDYKKGKAGSFEFLIGQIMKKTKGQADTEIIRTILEKSLN